MNETGSLGKISRQEWERMILDQTNENINLFLHELEDGKKLDSNPFKNFPRDNNDPVRRIIEELAQNESRARDGIRYLPNPKNQFKRERFLVYTAREIRNKKNYSQIWELAGCLGKIKFSTDPTSFTVWLRNMSAIYLMACEPDKFLVGIKDAEHWKHINIPITQFGPSEIPDAPLIFLGLNYLALAPYIGREQLSIAPSHFIHPKLFPRLNVPFGTNQVTDYLEDAYFRQRYIIPPGVVEVKFQNAGDLESMLIEDSGEQILSKVTTTKGESIVTINKDAGLIWSSHLDIPHVNEGPNLPRLVAETYHDLVTAEELPTRAYRPMKGLREVNPDTSKELSEGPRVIYIQRRVYEDSEPQEPRVIYTGPRRPPRPHVVSSGYPRRGNITEKHKEALRLWQEQTGIQVPLIPEGHTWVRPYFVPANAEQYLGELPLFIKQRIGTQLANRRHLVI